jgi:acetyl/propionyl-CoA carboxylase alpha subunit/acetyl-CoA carboxylase carboxyltransferase component
MTGPFGRIAVVNRGETAVRLIRAVRELEAERPSGLRSIALYTEPDRSSLFVREADEAYDLGSASFVDPHDGERKSRYLDYAALEHALRETGAEAAWVGWGFVAEHTRFAQLCQDLGVVFIGPGPEVMARLGDKIGSKRLAEKAGVPVAPWSGGPVESLDAARACAERLGYPLMVKATAGGGGRGIRKLRGPDELASAFESARAEALKGFGDDTVFLETLLEGARHVEVQIISDGQGATWALGVRDCSIQRRNQKVLEETPSPALDAEQERMLCDAAARLVDAAGYRNAGTVEFLYDPEIRAFSFMEVNARLQVEHPVTEETTGVDLVKLQIHVARGGRLEGPAPQPRGHAIEVRVNAEDPEHGFAPAPGEIALFRAPGGPGVRVDAGIAEGDRVAAEFDSMIAKVIARGRDRAEALARLERALAEMRLAVRGGASNQGFLLGLLRRPEVQRGEADNAWLDDLAARGEHLPETHGVAALVQGAIEAYEDGFAREREQFLATAARGRPRLRDEVGRAGELRVGGQTYDPRVFRLGPQSYRIQLDGRTAHARVEHVGPLERRLHLGPHTFRALSWSEGLAQVVEIDGIPHRLSRDDAGIVRAPSPAIVLSIPVQVGDAVEAGDLVAVLEAMKTELRVVAPCAGRVREIVTSTHSQVGSGETLVVLETLEQEAGHPAGERVLLDEGAEATPGGDARTRARHALDELRCLMLGFDVDPAASQRLLDEWRAACGELPAADPELAQAEDAVLAAFTDVCALFRGRQPGEGAASASSEEYLYGFLRSRPAAGTGLPEAFLQKLRRALAHYGVTSLEPGPALDEALLWICKAHRHMDAQAAAILRLLERRLDEPERLAAHEGEVHHGLLDRIVDATRARHPAVSDLAREVRYQSVDRHLVEEIRARVYAEADGHLAALAAGESSESHVAPLVECAEPLVNVLTARFAGADGQLRERMLEVLMRRYYRLRPLQELRTLEAGGCSVATAAYEHEGSRIQVIATCAPWGEREAAAQALRPLVEAVPAGSDVMLDLYLWQDGPHGEPDAVVAELRSVVEAAGFARRLRRVVGVVAAPGYGPGMSSMQHFTLRPGEGGFEEERVYRGIHPMMAKRLQLWRTGHFEIERLPSVEDVYVFHGKARSNPRDERLFAFAEVRDLTPVRDAEGRVQRLPCLEGMLLEALATIRRVQARRSARQRLHWNRVLLYLWPPLDLTGDELERLADRLAPFSEDLGIEKVVMHALRPDPVSGELRVAILQLTNPGDRSVALEITEPGAEPIRPLSEYGQKVLRMRQRGMTYPYEIVRMLAPPADGPHTAFPPGSFVEHDLDAQGRLVPVERPPGENAANLVVGVVRNVTERYPEGMSRVLLMGDPTHEMGSFAERECRRIIAALDLARELGVPLEWIAVSAGAKISMDSGTENLDWTAAALRRMIEFTQDGGEMNVVVAGVNVGGQSYWNAEATMLMHTRGILVMTADASMVLTGKQALDYSGGVSADDNQGIGGYDRIMGVNGQAQYWASDLAEACQILLRYYEHSYVQPGERFPRQAATSDPADRDIRDCPHAGSGEDDFARVGDIFRDETNPGRKRPFDIRSVMRAVVDRDHPPLERWRHMREAEVAVVWDAHLGGHPASVIGFDSKPIARLGLVPTDGPDAWTAGTLFPLSSKKVARAINAASGNRPVVVVANLSGFDGSPESMRRLQLEYGAEIGRAVVNFRGPIVFCVISRYHGGAYVVFSRTLNENLEVAALEGSYASVIGGAPAAAVVFSREVERRTRSDPRLEKLDAQIAEAGEAERGRLRARWHERAAEVRTEKLGEVASEFERVHSVERAREVGSLHEILPAARLRPYLIEAVERGMERERKRWQAARAAGPGGTG